MTYYRIVNSVSELIGEMGLLRLPSYIFNTYVFDDKRKTIFEKALKALNSGKNVLIVGHPGTGKTALMAMILNELIKEDKRIAYILEGVKNIGYDHISKGIILFYDDIPRISPEAARSIVLGKVIGIIATARTEELDDLRIKLGVPIEDIFEVFEIGKMSKEHLNNILNKYADAEGIIVDEKAKSIIVSKANGLPVYIWQAIRDARIQGIYKITDEFAIKIPQGMLDYVDEILWRILDEHEDRYPIILLLLIVSDMPKYEINSDLLLATFSECVAEFKGSEVSIDVAIKNELLTRVMRYMAKVGEFIYKFPHDSWGDVMKGRSRGLMSGEIARVNTLFPYDERLKIVKKAIERAENEIIRYVKNEARVRAFKEFIGRLEIDISEVNATPIKIGNKIKIKAVKVANFKEISSRLYPSKSEILSLSPFSKYLLKSTSIAMFAGTKVSKLVNKTYINKEDKANFFGYKSDVFEIAYPQSKELKVTEKLILVGTRHIKEVSDTIFNDAFFVDFLLSIAGIITLLALSAFDDFLTAITLFLLLIVLILIIPLLASTIFYLYKRNKAIRPFLIKRKNMPFSWDIYIPIFSELVLESADTSAISDVLFELVYENFNPVMGNGILKELAKRLGLNLKELVDEWNQIKRIIA